MLELFSYFKRFSKILIERIEEDEVYGEGENEEEIGNFDQTTA